MNYIQDYLYQIIATAIALVVFIALRYLVNSIISKFGKKRSSMRVVLIW